MVTEVGADVLRNIFDQRLQGVALDDLLANEMENLKILKQHDIITNAQFNMLYPPGGRPPKSADFDVALIWCLLIYLPSLGLDQNYRWYRQPQPTDTSVEADLFRFCDFIDKVSIKILKTIIFFIHDKSPVDTHDETCINISYTLLLR